jgi:hypothetical protein
MRQQGTAEGIRLDRDHHQVLAVCESLERMLHRGHRIAGRLDDDVDLRVGDDLAPVLDDGRRLHQLRRPAHALQVRLRVRRREVRDGHEPDAGRPRHLRQVHRRELARADQADAQRPVLALLELGVEVHAAFSSSFGVPFFHGSGTS